ncbi:MAG: ABC transporter permease [Deltaproteobacteria bacterium]|nr:ABC transporter permease [Deltaproteobacteria bacterium]MBF0524386.1 ABC transporter permease [Deltaproteobacteria bacterium]
MVRYLLGYIGHWAGKAVANLHQAARLINQTAYWLTIGSFKKGVRVGSLIHEMTAVGFNSIPIVAVIAFCIGMILALQAAYQLRRIGAMVYVADLVSLSIARELGPMLTAIIVAGRSGAAFTAEIGSMKVAEEIDALVTMGLNPIKFLVVPKFMAMLLMLPCLTLLADLTGMVAGGVIGVASLGLDAGVYYQQTLRAVAMKDIVGGLVKSLSFACIITLVGVHQGFLVEGGATSVGERTTSSVVTSIFLIILADCFFTTLSYIFT